MTFKEIKHCLQEVPDDVPVECLTIWNEEKQDYDSSAVAHIYYNPALNKIFITPEVICV